MYIFATELGDMTFGFSLYCYTPLHKKPFAHRQSSRAMLPARKVNRCTDDAGMDTTHKELLSDGKETAHIGGKKIG